mgnify:CR=1 FL=1
MSKVKERTNFRQDISNNTKELMKERDAAKKLIKKMSESEKIIQFTKYKRLRNRVISSLRQDKIKMTEEELEKGTNVWHVADKILGKEKHNELLRVNNGQAINRDLEKQN